MNKLTRSIVLLLFFLPFRLFSQELSGIWAGYIETSETRMPFELVINKDLSGYSMIVFSFNGVENVAVKTMKLIRNDSLFLMSDDKMIYNNFTIKSRRVKAYCELSVKMKDTVMILSGPLRTKSHDMRSLDKDMYTGNIVLSKQSNQAKTPLMHKLDSLQLTGTLSFANPSPVQKESEPIAEVQEKKLPVSRVQGPVFLNSSGNKFIVAAPASIAGVEKSVVWLVKFPVVEELAEVPEKVLPRSPVRSWIGMSPSKNKEIAFAPASITARKKTVQWLVKFPVIMATADPVINKPVVTASTAAKVPPTAEANRKKEQVAVTEPKKAAGTTIVTTTKPAVIPSTDSTALAKVNKTVNPISIPTGTEKQKSSQAAVSINVSPNTAGAATEIALRKMEIIRSIDFTSDSLVIILYDNGIVDGDTVSVVLNGQVIIPRQGLSEKAYRKVVTISPEMGDSLQLVMYAENLGSIPPNTGLLILEDGSNRQEIRFEGDMKKSSAVVLRRKKL